MGKLLIIDDDIASCRTLQLHYRSLGHVVNISHSSDQGLTAASASVPDVIILDIRMPGKDGLAALPEFKQSCPTTPIIMITAYDDMESTIRAMKQGADDYIHKPIDIRELDDAVSRALLRMKPDRRGLSLQNRDAVEIADRAMVGHSGAMKEVFKTIGLIANQPVNVLITGESGTGKELVARAIHGSGNLSSGPFVAVNCAALVETLLESELFGHEKGAFTGAVSRQIGKFAIAKHGIIFLDEISELSLTMQAKLLRVLQEREYVPLGANGPQTTNARVIAATNVDLADRVKKGQFREDLFYRLQVLTIHLPPLRERREDIVDLIQAMLTRINRDIRRKIDRLSEDVMESLQAYDWPGNVRELENVLMKAAVLSTSNIITREHIPDAIYNSKIYSNSSEKSQTQMSLKEAEHAHIKRVLEATGWHKGEACKILGISRPRLRRMMKEFGLESKSGDTHLSDQ
ncbi:MAG: sigma-54-dependent transcriptional regulator [Gammaproteobacteria bacterium]